MTAAVAAFNLLSSQGVHFTRIYQSMSRKGRPSFFQLARTAIKMTVIARPLAEADATMLREWENWNKASYFLLKPNGTLLITKYDREMDALYPQNNAQELLLTSRRGEPLGLVKMQPDKWPGTYRAWLYLHREADYAAPAIRSGIKELVKQAANAQDIRRITFHAAEYETALRDCYTACGFKHEGAIREALYLTNHYHDIHIHTAAIADL
jgi:RimJ/RimL family protein N-acetyltransferase